MPITNPYTFGDPVGKSPSFVGREDILKDVVRVLRHPKQNAITLYGQRRIGKTSILQYLEIHLPENGPFIPIYFDLMGRSGLPLGEILRQMACIIAQKLNQPDPDLGDNQEQSFRDAYLPNTLRNLPAEASLVFLLDEFDVLADPQAEQQAKRQFYSYMRDLRQLNPARLQFVFTLGRNLEDMDIVARALFKDLPARRVSLLTYEEMETLVRLSERTDGLQWSPEAVQRVWALTGGHPYLTQALCSHVWEEAFIGEETKRWIEPEDVEAAVPHALESSHNMLVWLWDGLGPAEKVVASALASAGPTVVNEDRLSAILAESGVRIMIGELRDAPQVLQQWDILAPADGGYRFRVELLRRWIAENKPLSRTQEELDRINPVAENFFAAARGLYLDSQLEQAEEALRRCLNLNPNHLRAHELLAEILMARGDLDEAQVWLEKLDEIAPGRARFRLKQLYLQRAESEADDATKLAWYKKILKMFPDDPLVNEYRRRIEIPMILNEVRELEARHAYSEALERLRALESLYPAEKDWQPELERLQAKVLMSEKYRQALEALSSGDHSRASQMLAEVIAIDPSYQDAARYLYLAVRGKDPELPLGKLLLSSTASPLQSNRLAYFLIFWPAILPLLGLGLGLIPGQDLAWPPQTYTLWAITAFIWLVLRSLLAGTFRKWLCNWFGDYINIIAGAVSGLILAIIAAIITISGRGIMTNIAVGFSVTAAFTGAVIINRNSTDTGVRVSGVVAACGTPVAILVSSIVGISGGGALEIALICVLVGLTTGIILRDVILWESIIASISIGIIIGGLVGLSSGNWMADTWEQRLISILGGSAVCIAATAVSFGLYVILDALDIKPPIPLGVILLIVSWLALIFITLGGLAWLQTGIWPQPVWPFG